ncbi:MAG TPA: DivIVA domain-containing protein [Jatrophihabitans sp.]|jgi:DivIVA domain-containing protein|nr:DivIVA domain-containing protein [Jatrophihabitans sp.]
MPLTPAEVHNVAFKKPPIGKRGYDEEEVDAFLDIVEVELSRLIEENNDLRARLSSGGQPAPQPAAAADGASAAELRASREENGRLQGRITELERTINQSKNGAQQQVMQLQQQLAQTERALAESRKQLEQAGQQLAAAAQQRPQGPNMSKDPSMSSEHHAQAVQMLALAQQTADQHLAQAKAEAERLVAEARANADATLADANDKAGRQVSEAEARAKQLNDESASRAAQALHDAEQRAATVTAQFEQRKAALERRVEELRTFEREYRTRLKSYLESQLRDLNASGQTESVNASGEYADAQQG